MNTILANRDSQAVVYAKQRGVKTTIGDKLSASGTVAQLYASAKGAGLKVTTKMRKEDLVHMIEHHNRAVSVVRRVDIDKLTPKQRRRLRKRGIS